MNKIKLQLLILSCLFFSAQSLQASPGGAPICDVEADYSNNFMNRPKNQNGGDFVLSANTDFYIYPGHVEIEIDGPAFTGIVMEVENTAGAKMGTFDFMEETGIQDCDGGAMSATHTFSHGSPTTRTLFWVPPEGVFEDMYVQAYVLKGVRGQTDDQEFYRFARLDTNTNDNALVLKSDVVFKDGLEQ